MKTHKIYVPTDMFLRIQAVRLQLVSSGRVVIKDIETYGNFLRFLQDWLEFMDALEIYNMEQIPSLSRCHAWHLGMDEIRYEYPYSTQGVSLSQWETGEVDPSILRLATLQIMQEEDVHD